VAVHFIVEPLSVVLFVVAPQVDPRALNLIHLKLPCVDRPIGKSELTMAILFAFIVFTFVDGAIRPRLQAEPVLLIVLPRADILCPIGVGVSTMAVSFIIDPVAFVNVTIRMVQLAPAISFS
jgi:hypothetical protein